MHDFFLAAQPLILQIFGLIVTAVVGWIGVRYHAATGMEMESKHREALNSAIMSGIESAMLNGTGVVDGTRIALGTMTNEVLEHVEKSTPDAIAAFSLTMSSPTFRRKIEAKIFEVMNALKQDVPGQPTLITKDGPVTIPVTVPVIKPEPGHVERKAPK